MRDAHGHEHAASGPGGGQFVSTGGAGSHSKHPGKNRRKARARKRKAAKKKPRETNTPRGPKPLYKSVKATKARAEKRAKASPKPAKTTDHKGESAHDKTTAGKHAPKVPGVRGESDTPVATARAKGKEIGKGKKGELFPEKVSSGSVVDGPENDHATAREHQIAQAIGAKQIGQRSGKDMPYDVLLHEGGRRHMIENKVMMKGANDQITMHADAKLRKINQILRRPNRTAHTVVTDDRQRYGGGQWKDNYSGHALYYKRGASDYKLGEMYKVKDYAELKRLVRMKDHELPEAARAPKDWPPAAGSPEYRKLQEQARKVLEGRRARSRSEDTKARKRRYNAMARSKAGA